MNSFDVVVYLGLTIAVVTGFNTGLLRSAIAILAYIAAMPIAMGLVPLVTPAPSRSASRRYKIGRAHV